MAVLVGKVAGNLRAMAVNLYCDKSSRVLTFSSGAA